MFHHIQVQIYLIETFSVLVTNYKIVDRLIEEIDQPILWALEDVSVCTRNSGLPMPYFSCRQTHVVFTHQNSIFVNEDEYYPLLCRYDAMSRS